MGFEGASIEGCVCINGKEIAGALNGLFLGFCELGEYVSECILERLGVVSIGPWSTKPAKDIVIPALGR